MQLKGTNRRRVPRRSRHYTAWISFAGESRNHDCHVLDIAEDGAKLIADVAVSVGNTFYFSSVPHALSRKRCEVVWRKNRKIGVRFV
jgi:hypothetical protein